MTARKEGVVLVFAKAPIPGQVKTRLIPALGATGAARLQIGLMRDTLAKLTAQLPFPVQLWCAPDAQHDAFVACQQDFTVTLAVQQGADLGERMDQALASVLRQYAWAVLVGCDCPDLQAEDIVNAGLALQQGHAAVLGPAEDGGYYLIGLDRPRSSLFDDVPWGTDQVLAITEARLLADGLSWQRLPLRQDIDRPEDLVHFPSLHPVFKR